MMPNKRLYVPVCSSVSDLNENRNATGFFDIGCLPTVAHLL